MHIQIGEFALSSGLTVKALRHYDEHGLLKPARVDEHTGYRFYDSSQLRHAVAIRGLRDAGLPLATIASAIRDPDALESALDVHQRSREAARAKEDESFAAGHALIAALRDPVTVQIRHRSEQPYVGVAMPADDELNDEDANAAFADLWRQLAAADEAPDGAWWVTVRNGGATGEAEMVMCWPTARPTTVPLVSALGTVESEVLPAGRELFVTVPQSPAGPTMAAQTTVAQIAMVEHADAHGIRLDPSCIRQIGVLDDTGMPIALEMVIQVSD